MEEGDPEVVGRGGVASSSFRTAFSPARGSPGRFVALLGRVGEASRRAGSIPLPGSFGVAWGGPVFRHGRAPLVGRCPRTPTCTCACGLSAAPGGRARAFSLLPFSSPPTPFLPPIDEATRVASERAPGGPALCAPCPREAAAASGVQARAASSPVRFPSFARWGARPLGPRAAAAAASGRVASPCRLVCPPALSVPQGSPDRIQLCDGRAAPRAAGVPISLWARRRRCPRFGARRVPAASSKPAGWQPRETAGNRGEASSSRRRRNEKTTGGCARPSGRARSSAARPAPDPSGCGGRGRPPASPPPSGRRSPCRFSCRVPARCGACRPGKGSPIVGSRPSRGRVLL